MITVKNVMEIKNIFVQFSLKRIPILFYFLLNFVSNSKVTKLGVKRAIVKSQ